MSPSLGTSYSATVRLELHVADQILELAQIGPDSLYLRTPTTLHPCEAEVVMYIDGQRTIWQVDLPEGLSSQNRESKLVRRQIGIFESFKQDARPEPDFSIEELLKLDQISEGLLRELGPSNSNSHFADVLQQEFANRCGRFVPAPILVAALVARIPRRETGHETCTSHAQNDDFDFGDAYETLSYM